MSTLPSPRSLILLGAPLAPLCLCEQIPAAKSIAGLNGPLEVVIPLSNKLFIRCLHVLPSVLAISVFSFSSVIAQSSFTGGLTGIASDPDGAAVSNVTVEITNERTGKFERSINGEADGSYSPVWDEV